METGDLPLEEFSAFAADPARVGALLADLRARSGAGWFYVFLASGGGRGAPSGRKRTLLAFVTPDAALAFAQRNQLDAGKGGPRLRRLSLARVVLAMLREPSIAAVLVVSDAEEGPAGRLPDGITISRDSVLRELGLQAP